MEMVGQRQDQSIGKNETLVNYPPTHIPRSVERSICMSVIPWTPQAAHGGGAGPAGGAERVVGG